MFGFDPFGHNSDHIQAMGAKAAGSIKLKTGFPDNVIRKFQFVVISVILIYVILISIVLLYPDVIIWIGLSTLFDTLIFDFQKDSYEHVLSASRWNRDVTLQFMQVQTASALMFPVITLGCFSFTWPEIGRPRTFFHHARFMRQRPLIMIGFYIMCVGGILLAFYLSWRVETGTGKYPITLSFSRFPDRWSQVFMWGAVYGFVIFFYSSMYCIGVLMYRNYKKIQRKGE